MCMYAYSYTRRTGGVRNFRNSMKIRESTAFCGLKYRFGRTCCACAVIVDNLLEQGRVRLLSADGPDLWYVWCAQNGKPVTLKQKKEIIKSFLTR